MAILTKKDTGFNNVDIEKELSTNRENEVKNSNYIKFIHRFKNSL